MNSVKVSVIVPVYNVSRYLENCVNSITDQDFTDFEIILVDDCSPDNSGEICDRLAKEDGRIRVIHKEKVCNMPVASGLFLPIRTIGLNRIPSRGF